MSWLMKVMLAVLAVGGWIGTKFSRKHQKEREKNGNSSTNR